MGFVVSLLLALAVLALFAALGLAAVFVFGALAVCGLLGETAFGRLYLAAFALGLVAPMLLLGGLLSASDPVREFSPKRSGVEIAEVMGISSEWLPEAA